MSPFSFLRGHPRGELAPYADGRLAPDAAARVEAHLAGCKGCRADVEAQRRVRAMLAALPDNPAPRSFALTPEMAGEPAPRAPATTPPLANGLRLASVGIALALAAVIVIDVGQDGGSPSTTDDITTQRQAETANVQGDAAAAQYDRDSSEESAGAPDAAATTAPTVPGDGSSGHTSGVETGGGAAGGGAGGAGGGTPDPGEGGVQPTEPTYPLSGLDGGGPVSAPPTPAPAATATDNATATAAPDEYAADLATGDSTDQAAGPAPADEAGDGDSLLWLEALLIVALVAGVAGSVMVTRAARRRE
jgi:hypothetical protein